MSVSPIIKFNKLSKVLCSNPPNNLRVLFNFKNIKQPNNVLPIHARNISTFEAKSIKNNDSLVKQILNKVPFFNYTKHKMLAVGHYLYEDIADKIDYIDFFEELDLPDTFYTWFVITELHIWMLSVRIMAEGDEGRWLRNSLVTALWADVTQRVKKLGTGSSAIVKHSIAELSEQFQAALIAYDEGLQSDDTILAGALWRRFYQHSEVKPEHLDLLVKYIRRQCRILDHLSREHLLEHREIKWESLRKIKTFH